MTLMPPPTGSSRAADWFRRIHAALMRQQVKPGAQYRVEETPRGTLLHFKPKRGKAKPSEGIVRCVVADRFIDYLLCTRLDTGEGIRVARPEVLRPVPLDGQTINGFLYTYSPTGEGRTLRKASSPSGTIVAISEIAEPGYAIGAVPSVGTTLWAMRATDTGLEERFGVEWIDVNVHARAPRPGRLVRVLCQNAEGYAAIFIMGHPARVV